LIDPKIDLVRKNFKFKYFCGKEILLFRIFLITCLKKHPNMIIQNVMKTNLQNQFHHSKSIVKNQFHSIKFGQQLHSKLFKTKIILNNFSPINQGKSQSHYRKCRAIYLNFTIMILNFNT